MNICEYKLLTETDNLALNRAVNSYLDNGWLLYMGPVVSVSDVKSRYAQALVRESVQVTKE
jgi:hypothetical protein